MLYRSILAKRTLILLTAAISIGVLSLLQAIVLATEIKPTPVTMDSLLAAPPITGTLTMTTADPTLATHYGETLVTATLQDGGGQPIVGGIVQFASTLGTMSPLSATTDLAGRASATFIAGPMPGPAEVAVTYNGLSQSVTLLLKTPQVSDLNLQISADQLLVDQSLVITTTIRDQFGRPAAGELVSLFGSLGTVSPSSSLSNEAGQIIALFTAGTLPGQARISALAGYDSQTAELQISKPIIIADNFLYLPLIIR